MRVIAELIYEKTHSISGVWVQHAVIPLNQPIIRIGRSAICEVIIKPTDDASRYISRVHCTLFFYAGSTDYELMDGTIAFSDNGDAQLVKSSMGVYVNGRKLESYEKIKMHNGLEFYLVPDKIRFRYVRQELRNYEVIDDTEVPKDYY